LAAPPFDHVVENILLHEEPRSGIAALPEIEEKSRRGARDGGIDIRIA
jgi:hypothetical protein